MFNAPQLLMHIAEVLSAHSFHAREPSKAFRKFDGKTLYVVHPLWCATTIATEDKLDAELRELGFYTLLWHDVPEDTTKALPEALSEKVAEAVGDMTFENSQDEMKRIWEKSPEIRLFKLYDKTNNLINMDGWDPDKVDNYVRYASLLAIDVMKNFGTLNIHYIFNGIVDKYVTRKPNE